MAFCRNCFNRGLADCRCREVLSAHYGGSIRSREYPLFVTDPPTLGTKKQTTLMIDGPLWKKKEPLFGDD